MTGFEEVDVEVWIGSPLPADVLGVFVHHPNPDGRVNAETMAFAAGAEYTVYPGGPVPRLTESGKVDITPDGMTIALGRILVVSPLLAKAEEIAHLNFACIFLADTPFGGPEQEEKAWLAARVPLVFSDKENV